MARMVFAAARRCFDNALPSLALEPDSADQARRWSIDDEPMGSGWHDSSWLLRRGLDVIEDAPGDAIPPEWSVRWWAASIALLTPSTA